MRTTFLQHYLCPPPPFRLSPGDKLCSAEDCIPGTGVYLRHGYIYSSLAGYVLRKNEGEEVRGVVGESCRSKQACRSARGKVLSNICECDWPVIVCSAPVVKYGPYFVWQVFSLGCFCFTAELNWFCVKWVSVCINSCDVCLFLVTSDLCGQGNRNTTTTRCRSYSHL